MLLKKKVGTYGGTQKNVRPTIDLTIVSEILF